MPWTPDDAERHTYKATTRELKELWAKVANECLDRTGDEGRAIREANAVIARQSRPPTPPPLFPKFVVHRGMTVSDQDDVSPEILLPPNSGTRSYGDASNSSADADVPKKHSKYWAQPNAIFRLVPTAARYGRQDSSDPSRTQRAWHSLPWRGHHRCEA